MNEFNQTIIQTKKTINLKLCEYSFEYQKAKRYYNLENILSMIAGYKKVSKYNYDFEKYKLNTDILKMDQL
jgi:hypothetical protein